MTMPEALRSVRYVVNAEGERTDAVIPLAAWKALLTVWRRSLEIAEDNEDLAILQDWLENRAAGKGEMVPLEDLEAELASDGLL